MIQSKRKRSKEQLEEPTRRSHCLALDQFEPGESYSVAQLMQTEFGDEYQQSTLHSALSILRQSGWIHKLPTGEGRERIYCLTERAISQINVHDPKEVMADE